MAIVTAQLLSKYYDLYRNTEVVLTKDIIRALAIDPRQIYIKCAGSQWPCIINSTSFTQAKIIVGTKGGAFQALASKGQKESQAVSIRFSFYQADGQLGTFFITGKVSSIAPYGGGKEPDLVLVTIQYTQRPPDDLIEMIGHMLDANANAESRKDERIMLTPDICRKLGLVKTECTITIQSVPRHCIVRDISFYSAKVVIQGLSQYLTNKEASLALEFDEPQETLNIKGIISNTTAIAGSKGIISADIAFDKASLPISYKVHINNYLSSVMKNEREQAKAEQAAVKEAIKAQEKAARKEARAAAAASNPPAN